MDPYATETGGMKEAFSRYASEFSGTFILIASIKFIVGSGTDLAPLAIGFTLQMIVYLHGHNSLGMFNPSVLIAHIVRNKLLHGISPHLGEVTMYLVAQFLGAIFGGLFVAVIFDKKYGNVHVFVSEGTNAVEALFAELMFTIILVMANMHCAANKKTAGNQFYGLAIGTVLFVGASAIGGISGCAINLAVWVGTVTSAAVNGSPELRHCWIYFVAHIVAGVYSGVYYTFVHPDFDKKVGRVFRVASTGNSNTRGAKGKKRVQYTDVKKDMEVEMDEDDNMV